MATPSPLYLDHNATTPLDPRVFEAMRPYFFEHFGNPSSVEHSYGLAAASAVERARERVAEAIGAETAEIVFTASCTESNNLAILGIARAAGRPRHFITSPIEHPAVLEVFRQLEREGHQVSFVPVDELARVRLDVLRDLITPQTALISIMAANNEVGTIQPLVEIGKLCAERDILFHSDLAQMPAYVSIDVASCGVHLASLSGHKAYGPKGVGALYIRKQRPRIKLEPLMWGGGQERAIRPGTLNTPLIVGMGEAMYFAKQTLATSAKHVTDYCTALRDHLLERVKGIWLNGDPDRRLPNNLALSVDGVEPLALMRLLRDHVSFSASSACSTRDVKTSSVLLAMFGDTPRARNAFRLSPGRFTPPETVAAIADLIADGVERLRAMK